MKILILNPNHIRRFNWGHQLFKNEFSQQHEVIYYGEGFPGYRKDLSIPKYLEKIRKKKKKDFDLIITYESKWTRVFQGLEDVDVPKAHIVIDYVKPRSNFKGFSIWPNVDEHLKKIKPDIIFARTSRDVEDLKINLDFGKVFFLPFSVDTSKYLDKNKDRYIDVMASFSTRRDVYPLRRKIQRLVTKMPVQSFVTRVTNYKYIEKLNAAKIFINSGSVYKRLTMKFTEILACGTFLITEEAEDMKAAGFEPGKHLVVFKNMNDLKSKINYFLKHDKDRKIIAKRGMKFVRANHSNKVRVQQFIDKVREEILK